MHSSHPDGPPQPQRQRQTQFSVRRSPPTTTPNPNTYRMGKSVSLPPAPMGDAHQQSRAQEKILARKPTPFNADLAAAIKSSGLSAAMTEGSDMSDASASNSKAHEDILVDINTTVNASSGRLHIDTKDMDITRLLGIEAEPVVEEEDVGGEEEGEEDDGEGRQHGEEGEEGEKGKEAEVSTSTAMSGATNGSTTNQ